MSALDFDLDEFASMARIEETGIALTPLPQLPAPHALAVEVLRKFAGKRLVPRGIGSNEDYNIVFGIDDEIAGYQAGIHKLSIILRDHLHPIGKAHNESVIVLLSNSGTVFVLSVNSFDVYFLGRMREAVSATLTGRSATPVLPKRPFIQEHGYEEYSPGCEGVMWMDTDDWIIETNPEVLAQKAAVWDRAFSAL